MQISENNIDGVGGGGGIEEWRIDKIYNALSVKYLHVLRLNI